jgi:hypothetical protein
MFGLFKRDKAQLLPDEPIELKVGIEIARPAAEVYALLDFGDERNQMRARGNIVRRESDRPEVYRLWYNRAPDLNFLFTVTDAVPGARYAFLADIVPPVGRRLGTHECYELEALDDGSCRVTFVNTIRHIPGLTQDELSDEIGKSTLAAANGLTKLKLQAELGVAAVESFEREMRQR